MERAKIEEDNGIRENNIDNEKDRNIILLKITNEKIIGMKGKGVERERTKRN